MKKLISLAIVLTFMISALSVSLVSAIPDKEKSNVEKHNITTDEVEVVFRDGVFLHDLRKINENENLTIRQIVTESVIDEESYTTFHVINGKKDIEEIITEYTKQFEALLIDSIAFKSSAEKSKLEKQLKKFNDNGKSLELSKIYIEYNDNSNMKEFEKIFKNDIERISDKPIKKNNNEVSENEVVTIKTSASNWVPTSGQGAVFPSTVTTDATYLEVEYKYNSASDLSTLTGDEDSTLEGELVLYNYNDEALADNWYADHGSSWTFVSNQPYAYIDTQAFDNSDEPRFTIGCASAKDLTSGTDYYWRAYGNETGQSGGSVKLYFQRGHRIIDSIYSPWNIFQDETVVVIPFSSWPSSVSTKTFTYSD